VAYLVQKVRHWSSINRHHDVKSSLLLLILAVFSIKSSVPWSRSWPDCPKRMQILKLKVRLDQEKSTQDDGINQF